MHVCVCVYVSVCENINAPYVIDNLNALFPSCLTQHDIKG